MQQCESDKWKEKQRSYGYGKSKCSKLDAHVKRFVRPRYPLQKLNQTWRELATWLECISFANYMAILRIIKTKLNIPKSVFFLQKKFPSPPLANIMSCQWRKIIIKLNNCGGHLILPIVLQLYGKRCFHQFRSKLNIPLNTSNKEKW